MFNQILNDGTQFKIQVTKNVKKKSLTKVSENYKALQDSKLDKIDEKFQEREAEINKLKQSIIGRPGGLSEDGTN